MHHIHFETLHSTQIYLRDNLSELQRNSSQILVTTDEQTQGIGRNRNIWDFYPRSIAMSFTLSPHKVPTLTPLEIGLLVTSFFEEKWNVPIFVKWPNDLLTQKDLKCGGIITQYINSETVIAGLGLNLFKVQEQKQLAHNYELKKNQYSHGFDVVFYDEERVFGKELERNFSNDLSLDLYKFILSRRIVDIRELKTCFYRRCSHINKRVSIEDDGFEFEGNFLGIGDNGEALVDVEGRTRAFLSSSLKIISNH